MFSLSHRAPATCLYILFCSFVVFLLSTNGHTKRIFRITRNWQLSWICVCVLVFLWCIVRFDEITKFDCIVTNLLKMTSGINYKECCTKAPTTGTEKVRQCFFSHSPLFWHVEARNVTYLAMFWTEKKIRSALNATTGQKSVYNVHNKLEIYHVALHVQFNRALLQQCFQLKLIKFGNVINSFVFFLSFLWQYVRIHERLI